MLQLLLVATTLWTAQAEVDRAALGHEMDVGQPGAPCRECYRRERGDCRRIPGCTALVRGKDDCVKKGVPSEFGTVNGDYCALSGGQYRCGQGGVLCCNEGSKPKANRDGFYCPGGPIKVSTDVPTCCGDLESCWSFDKECDGCRGYLNSCCEDKNCGGNRYCKAGSDMNSCENNGDDVHRSEDNRCKIGGSRAEGICDKRKPKSAWDSCANCMLGFTYTMGNDWCCTWADYRKYNNNKDPNVNHLIFKCYCWDEYTWGDEAAVAEAQVGNECYRSCRRGGGSFHECNADCSEMNEEAAVGKEIKCTTDNDCPDALLCKIVPGYSYCAMPTFTADETEVGEEAAVGALAMTRSSEPGSLPLVVKVLAAIGLSATFYGAFRHYTQK